MSNLISRIARLATPDHDLFGFYDEGGDYLKVRMSGIAWFAATEGDVLISPAQDFIEQGIQFEHWAGKPNSADNKAEREATGGRVDTVRGRARALGSLLPTLTGGEANTSTRTSTTVSAWTPSTGPGRVRRRGGRARTGALSYSTVSCCLDH
ncbi:hypothetical protein [Actinomadura litoris]|uniref:hypothetical protein n=1 Tax=Actinomadura litoris TaxID=2678616 RepID=UPI001FA78DCE|nr:hypothetical protein [Actinomadura litoris]